MEMREKAPSYLGLLLHLERVVVRREADLLVVRKLQHLLHFAADGHLCALVGGCLGPHGNAVLLVADVDHGAANLVVFLELLPDHR